MPHPRCRDCHDTAVCYEPHRMCQAHAEMFYTKIVRIGSALAELNREAPSGTTIWDQQVPVTPDDPDDPLGVIPKQGRRTCRVLGCLYAPRTRWGTFCAAHLRIRRSEHSQTMVNRRQAERQAARERAQWS